MNKVSKQDIIDNAKALKIALTEDEVNYFVDEVNTFFENRLELDCSMMDENCVDISEMRYVNKEVVNVFSAREENLITAEELLINTKDKEGNYVKVPKVLK